MSSRNPLIPHTYLLLILLGAGAVACGDDNNLTVPPTTASIEVTTSTTGAEPDADVFAYDPVVNTWIRKADMNHDRAGPSAGTIHDASGRPRIIAAGGLEKGEGGIKVAEVYTP